MNNEFKQGRLEFKQKNYKKALGHFENVKIDDEDYEYSLPYKISCLIELKRYREALTYINPLIEKNPYDELLWFDKVTCHIFLDEDENAYAALKTIERIVDLTDKGRLLFVAKFYNMLEDYPKVIEFCNRALEVDRNYREALLEKSFAALQLDDFDMVNSISDRLLEISDGNILSLTPVFMLKLFSKDYAGCLDLINSSVDDDVKSETIELFKSVIYNKLSEDLSAQILMTQKIEISVDDALKLMLDFKEHGVDSGRINGVQYFIV